MDRKELQALIELIDDPDDQVFQKIRNELIAQGDEVIPELETAWESGSYGLTFQQRIEDIVHEIQFRGVKDRLAEWTRDGGKDLLEGVLLVNKYQYPDLDEEEVRKTLDKIKKDVWLELNENLTAFEKVKVINHILYEVHGFHGNKKNFHSPHNLYLNNVLETHSGNPLTLGIIYILVCQEYDIPVGGVNLPNHFILAYLDHNEILKEILPGNDDGVLFYINPFGKGGIFHRKEIDAFLKQLKAEPRDQYYYPCDNITIVKRLLNDLIVSYHRSGYPEKIAELKELREPLKKALGEEEDPSEGEDPSSGL